MASVLTLTHVKPLMFKFLQKQRACHGVVTMLTPAGVSTGYSSLFVGQGYHPMMFSTFTTQLSSLGKPGAISPLRPMAIMAAA